MKKRIIGFVLTLAMLLSCLPSVALPVWAQTPGGATEISDAAGLAAIKDDLDGSYVLTQDITLTGEWAPIAGFAGTLDGDGHTITGLTISGSYDVSKDLGMFSSVAAGATIQNLTLKDASITVIQTADKPMNVGLLAAKIDYSATSTENTLIDNCAVTGNSSVSVTANAIGVEAWTAMRVGGLIGNLDANVSASGTVTVINCFNEADVSVTATSGGGSAIVGGIGGYIGVNGRNATFHISNCGSIGELTASSSVKAGYIGGIAGQTRGQSTSVTKPTVDNCYSAGTMTGGTKIGNIVGQSSYVDNNYLRLYGLVSGGSIPGTAITAAMVTDGTLLEDLNTNITAINGALAWAANTAGYPVPTAAAAEAPTQVQVSWTAPTNGTLTVTKEDNTTVTSPATLPSGTVLNITVTPDSGYALKELTVNGETVTVTGSTYALTLPEEENVTIAATFESAEWVNAAVTPSKVGDVYQITKAEELAWIINNGENKSFVLTKDIDLSGRTWKPIESFASTLDGNNHKIIGMTMDLTNTSGVAYAGLIRIMRPGAKVKNLTFEDVSITVTQNADSQVYVGTVAAYLTNNANFSTGDTVIDHCAVTGDSNITVTTNAINGWKVVGVGGALGYANAQAAFSTEIRNFYNSANITGTSTSTAMQIGGIIGAQEHVFGIAASTKVLNCANVGDLTANGTGTAYIGGLLGRAVKRQGTALDIRNCYNAGNVTSNAASKYAGTAVGQNNSGTFTNCYGMTVTGGNSVSGVSHKTTEELKSADFSETLNSQVVEAEGMRYWISAADSYPVPTATTKPKQNVQVSWTAPTNGNLAVTKADNTTVTSPATLPSGTVLNITVTPASGYALKELTVNGETVTVTGSTYALTLTDKDVTVAAVFEKAAWENAAVEPAKVGDVYQITKAEELAWLINNGQNKSFVLTKDIDLSGRTWTPIAEDLVTLDGKGYTISNMKITEGNTAKAPGTLYAGLFADTWNSSIKNLQFTNVNIDVTGESNTTVYVGAIAGQATGNTVIDRCYVKSGTIKAVANILTTTSPTKNLGLGGLVGNVSGTSETERVKISNCYNAAALVAHNAGTTGQYYVGGIAANMARTNVINCANIGTMTATGTVHQARLGGVVGVNNAYCTLKNSYSANLCDVTGLSKNDEQYNAITNKGVLARGDGQETTSTYEPNSKTNEKLLAALNGYVETSDEDLAYWTPATDSYPIPGVLLKSARLVLESGEICVEYIAQTSVSGLTDVKMKFAVGNRTPVEATGVLDDQGRYVFACPVAAKEMNDTIIGELYISGQKIQTKAYSVKTYADTVISAGTVTYGENLVNLMKAMLDYGASAQLQFKHNTTNLANGGNFTDMSAVTADALSSYVGEKTANVTGLTLQGANLSLVSKTTLRFGFKLGEGANVNDYTVTVNGKPAKLTRSGGFYCVEVTGILAQNLDEDQVVTITKDNETQTLTYSVYDLVRLIIKEGSAQPENFQKLAKALYLYGQAAGTYVVAPNT